MNNKTRNETEDLPAITALPDNVSRGRRALSRWQAGATTVKELIEMYKLQGKGWLLFSRRMREE